MVSKLNQNHHGTSVNTKFDKLSALRNKLYSVTPLPKYQFIPKVVEINYLSKIITSHLHTNTIIKKCTKVLAPGLLKIESEPINAYFKKNRVVHRDYLKVTKEHVKTLQELLEQTRALKPLDENLDYACKVVQRIQELLVYVSASCPFIVSGNEKWAPATSHKKNNKLYVDTLGLSKPSITNTQQYVAKQNIQKIDKSVFPSTGRVSYTNSSRSQPRINTKNDRIQRPSSKSEKNTIVEIVLWYLDSGCSKHMTAIMGYDDLQFGNVLITGVYYVEGLGHNLFSTRQFCDSDLEVEFRKHTYFICNLDGVDLLSGSCGTNNYTISLNDMMKSSPIFLLSKASKMKSWLWHRGLSHLNFGTINQLAKQDLVRGFPELKYAKDHLCFACQMGKRKKESRKPKTIPSSNEKLHMLHMDLCGPMWVESINGTNSRPELQPLTHRHISSGLVQNQVVSTSAKPPLKNDLDLLFQPMFDEYFKPPLSVVSTTIFAATLPTPDTDEASSSTSIDQDACRCIKSLNK
ncbi:retrovirus-related pol polyprotein from transposon TNT 1-94 [Tanacetum coccineum]